MYKIIIAIIVIGVIIAIVALWPTQPPADIPQATVTDRDNTTEIPQTILQDEISVEKRDAVAAVVTTLQNAELIITGFGPGKIHPGTFTERTIQNIAVDDSGLIVSGTAIVKVASRDFGIDRLNTHLCAENFFHCDTYPEIRFDLRAIAMSAPAIGNETAPVQLQVSGDLTFKGVTKTISVPVTQLNGVYEANFRLNVAQFGFTYTGVDEEVQIQIKTK